MVTNRWELLLSPFWWITLGHFQNRRKYSIKLYADRSGNDHSLHIGTEEEQEKYQSGFTTLLRWYYWTKEGKSCHTKCLYHSTNLSLF
jgi:hypothetical protein